MRYELHGCRNVKYWLILHILKRLGCFKVIWCGKWKQKVWLDNSVVFLRHDFWHSHFPIFETKGRKAWFISSNNTGPLSGFSKILEFIKYCVPIVLVYVLQCFNQQ